MARAAALRPPLGSSRLGMVSRPKVAGEQLAARPVQAPRLPLRPRRAFQRPTATSSAAAAAPGPPPSGGSSQQQQQQQQQKPAEPPLGVMDPPPVQLTGAVHRPSGCSSI